jgi:gluconokinase
MGVCGVGKSTVGWRLADSMGLKFIDADDFHSKKNREQMSIGHPLDEKSRTPWLKAIAKKLDYSVKAGESLVLACSALRKAHRDILLARCPNNKIVFLHGDECLIKQRLRDRQGHFVDERLLKSQFETLEEPVDAIKIVLTSKSSIGSTTNQIMSLLRSFEGC